MVSPDPSESVRAPQSSVLWPYFFVQVKVHQKLHKHDGISFKAFHVSSSILSEMQGAHCRGELSPVFPAFSIISLFKRSVLLICNPMPFHAISSPLLRPVLDPILSSLRRTLAVLHFLLCRAWLLYTLWRLTAAFACPSYPYRNVAAITSAVPRKNTL